MKPVREKSIPGEVFYSPAPHISPQERKDAAQHLKPVSPQSAHLSQDPQADLDNDIQDIQNSREAMQKQANALNQMNPTSEVFQENIKQYTEGLQILEQLKVLRDSSKLKTLLWVEGIFLLPFFILRWMILKKIHSFWARLGMRFLLFLTLISCVFILIPYLVLGSDYLNLVVGGVKFLVKVTSQKQ